MTKEELKELFSAWLDGKTIQFYQTYKEKWADEKNPIWDKQFKYRVKPTKIEFKDCSFNDEEHCVDIFGRISTIDTADFNIKDRINFIKDKEIAEAYAVLPQLIRLRDEYNEGWKPDWKDENTAKYYIGRYGNDWDIDFTYKYPYLLCFKSFAIRNKFLEDHRDLIEIAKPFL